MTKGNCIMMYSFYEKEWSGNEAEEKIAQKYQQI
jgi:hypothetical protein